MPQICELGIHENEINLTLRYCKTGGLERCEEGMAEDISNFSEDILYLSRQVYEVRI